MITQQNSLNVQVQSREDSQIKTNTITTEDPKYSRAIAFSRDLYNFRPLDEIL